MARPPRTPRTPRPARDARPSRPPRNQSGKRPTGLPTRKQILDFIASSDQPAGKREIARAFGLSGQDKIDLKRLLKDMADEGLIDSSPGRAFHQAGGVPKVTVLRVSQVDDSGHVFAVPEQWQAETAPPRDSSANSTQLPAPLRALLRQRTPVSALARTPLCMRTPD